MGAQSAFQCDGPKCTELTPKAKGERGAPQQWIRITIAIPGSADKVDGAFHDITCAHAWVDTQLGVTHAPTSEQPGAARDAKL